MKVVPAAEVLAELARRLAMRCVRGPVLLCDADVIRRLWIEEFHAGERAA